MPTCPLLPSTGSATPGSFASVKFTAWRHFTTSFGLIPREDTRSKSVWARPAMSAAATLSWKILNVNWKSNEGETTPDREFSIDRVACVGCCALAPVAISRRNGSGTYGPQQGGRTDPASPDMKRKNWKEKKKKNQSDE